MKRSTEIPYDISSNEPLSGVLICAVYDENGVLSSVSLEKNETAQQEWIIDVNADFEKGMSKMFFWNSVNGMQPWVGANS